MKTPAEKISAVIKKAIEDTRKHIDESDPLEFKIELEENIADCMIEASLYTNAYTAIITGSGEDLHVKIEYVDEGGKVWSGSNK